MLLDPIKELRGHYDYISRYGSQRADHHPGAYMAADYFILSTTPQRFSIAGLEDAARDIQAAIRLGNAKLRVLGVVVSDVDTRTRLARLHIDLIEDLFRRGPATLRDV